METICTFAQGKFVCFEFDSGSLTHLNLLNSVKYPDEICVQCLLKFVKSFADANEKCPQRRT